MALTQKDKERKNKHLFKLLFWLLKYEYNKIIKHCYLRVPNAKTTKQNQNTYEKNQKYLEMNT